MQVDSVVVVEAVVVVAVAVVVALGGHWDAHLVWEKVNHRLLVDAHSGVDVALSVLPSVVG